MEGKEEIVYKLLCMACLCVGRSLQKITDLRIKQYYLDALKEIPICNVLETCPIVCWECNAMLKKVVTFREQVKDSYRILQTYAHVNLHECLATDVIRPPRLTIQVVEPISITPEICSEQDTREEQVYVKEELKVDWDDDDRDFQDDSVDDYKTDNPSTHSSIPVEKEIDAEIEAFIGKIKKDKRRRKNLNSKDKKAKRVVKNLKNGKKRLKRSKLQNEQKILTIELSYEEMLKERKKESLRDSYVKSEYKCQDCLIGFNYSKSYKTHLDNKHSLELGNYSCPICKTVISSVESFTAHYKRHMRRYQCRICNKRTMDLKVMQQHYYSTHEISLKDYKCNLCGKISNSIDTHRYHRDSHKARVACSDCDKTFSHRAGLMNHRLAVHELQNAFPCEVCGKVFRWKTSLKRHLEKHDAKSKSNEKAAAYCSQCGVSFSSVCSYQRHMKNSLKHVTQEQLRFICDECGRRFADKTKLRDHIEEKHLHKTYECHICHKPSKNRVGLDQHIRNVHKGRPNNKMCHHCGRGFPTKVQLESHIRTHTGERPFICEFCPTTFSQQSNLYKHNRQVHLNMKSKRSTSCKKREEKVESTSSEVAADGESSYNRAFTITLFRDGFCESLPDPRVTSVL